MSNSVNNEGMDPEKWAAVFEEFEKEYKDAYYNVDKAIKLEEEGNLTEALPFYEFGLTLIDKALDLPITEPLKPDFSWEKTIAMMQKLRKTRKEIMIRINNNKSKPQTEATELPPSYEEVVESSKSESVGTGHTNGNHNNSLELPGHSKTDVPYVPPSALQDEKLLANLHRDGEGSSNASVTYFDLSQQLNEMKLAKNEEILFRCDNVHLYFIAPDGRVSTTKHSSTMLIARVHDVSLDPASQTFLQVDSWITPLIPTASFCLRHSSGAFILPDIHSNVEGAAVGLIVPEDVKDEVDELFSKLLNEPISKEKCRESPVADYTPDKNSSMFLKGTAYLAHILIKGASNAAEFIDSSTPKIINQISPQPEPQPINPTVQKAVEVANTVSGKAVSVTDYLATKVCSATVALGRYLSPYVQKQGSQLLAYTTNTTEKEALQKINSVLNITSDTLKGVSAIYSGLETASSILSKSLANNTVQIIEYKYGQAAGALTNDAFTTIGNVYYTSHNYRNLKPKGLAKTALKKTGQALLEDSKKSKAALSKAPR